MRKKRRSVCARSWSFSSRNKRKKRKWLPWALLTPSLAGVGIFVLFPFIDVVRRSFFTAMGGEFVGLENYKSVLENQAFRLAAGNTARFLALCLPLLLGFSLLAAVWVCGLRKRGGFFKTGFLIPLAAPAASGALFWKIFLADNGILNQELAKLGISGPDYLNTDWAFWALLALYLWKNTGYDMVLWCGGLLSIPDSLYEAAKIDGAGGLSCFWFITCPLLVRTAFLTGILSIVNMFKLFRESWTLCGNYPEDSVYMLQNVFNNWFSSLDMQKMTAGAVLLALLLGLILAGSQRAEERWGE